MHEKERCPFTMITIIAILGLCTLAMSFLGPVMPLYITDLGFSPEILGLMLAVAMVGMAIGETAWGWAADRWGLRLSMYTGTFFTAASVILFAFTEQIAALFAIFLIWGFTRSAVFGPGRGYIATNAPQHRKSTYMAVSAVMLSVSRSIGALPGGYMYDTFGADSVFYVSFGVALAGGILYLLFRKNIRLSATPAETDVTVETGDTPAPRRFSYFSLTPQCGVTALRFFGLGASVSFLPLLASQVVGVDATGVGVLFTITGLVTVVLSIPAGMLADRIGKKNTMIAGLVVSVAALVWLATVETFPVLIAAAIANSLGMVLFSPAALGLFSDSVPMNRQSTAMGIYGGVCENVGIIAGSSLGGFIWSAFGPAPTFYLGAVASALAAAVCIFLVKDRHIRTAA